MTNPALSEGFLKTLMYFDIFSYPLTASEIYRFSPLQNINEKICIKILDELRELGFIQHKQDFYFLGDDESCVYQRIEDNKRASERIGTAKKYARLVASFPFVRAVFISGSLSKNVMKPDSDIDFFIITKPGRLWLCRAILTLFKKIFLGNSYRNFCLNYFIDTKSLEIEQKNIYTATEIATLIPMYNMTLYTQFMLANNWYKTFYPNNEEYRNEYVTDARFLKKTIEIMLLPFISNPLDNFFFKIITGYWKRKFSYMNRESFALNFRSSKNISKHHPHAYQEYVLAQITKKIKNFERKFGFIFSENSKLVA